MADRSAIEWTDTTWNPVAGCSVISPGCTNCYAMRMAARLEAMGVPIYAGLTRPSKAGPVWTGAVRSATDAITKPLHWRKPRRIFVNSMSDLFHEAVPVEVIDQVFAVMALTRQHSYQLLTKRAERMRAYLTDRETWGRICAQIVTLAAARGMERYDISWPLRNVWLGVSVEDQRRADERVPILLDTPAAVRWISAEPLLGPVDVAWTLARNRLDIAAGFLRRGHFSPGLERLRPLDWVVAGGESGPDARAMHPAWPRGLRDQCAAAGVPFLFKQWGAFRPTEPDDDPEGPYTMAWPDGHLGGGHAAQNGGLGTSLSLVSKKAAGRTLDGEIHDAFPEARP